MQFFTPAFLAALVLNLPALVSAQDPNGFFIVNCAPLTIQRSDPIVDPGVPSGHVHAIIGGTAFRRSMSPDLAKTARATTCDKTMDKSNYWQPQLYHQRSDGQFDMVKFEGAAVYYLSRACDYAPGRQNCQGTPYPRAPPAGLRMVAGNPNLRTYNHNDFAQRAISHACLKNTPVPESNGLPRESCQRLRSQVFLPSCWNGRDLDSPNHKSHMAYPAIGTYNGGVCPESHPVAIFSIFYEFFYNTAPFPAWQNLVYAMGDKTGYGLHGDFINGWTDQNALQNSIATCTGPQGVAAPGCSLGRPGSSSNQSPEVSAPYEEDIGLTGPISRLPGNNPVARRSRIEQRTPAEVHRGNIAMGATDAEMRIAASE